MTDHIRKQVRDAVATILDTGTPTNWVKPVEKTRIPSPRQKWPFLMVYSTGEGDEAISPLNPAIYLRTIGISVVGMLRLPGSGDTISIEDKMDALALEVESKLTFNALESTLSGVQTLLMQGTELDVVVSEDGAIDHAEVIINFEITCASAEDAPATIL